MSPSASITSEADLPRLSPSKRVEFSREAPQTHEIPAREGPSSSQALTESIEMQESPTKSPAAAAAAAAAITTTTTTGNQGRVSHIAKTVDYLASELALDIYQTIQQVDRSSISTRRMFNRKPANWKRPDRPDLASRPENVTVFEHVQPRPADEPAQPRASQPQPQPSTSRGQQQQQQQPSTSREQQQQPSVSASNITTFQMPPPPKKPFPSLEYSKHDSDDSDDSDFQESSIGPSAPLNFKYFEMKGILGNRQGLIVATNASQPRDTIAVRIRSGSVGYNEWMNELQVYLLPKFKHNNILGFFASDKRFSKDNPYLQNIDHYAKVRTMNVQRGRAADDDDSAGENDDENDDDADDADDEGHIQRRRKPPSNKMRIEYWLMNKFYNCTTLRDYLKMNTLAWPELIHIATGIVRGIHFLHENAEYQDFDTRRAVDGFIRSTKGAIKRIAFSDTNFVIHMKPHLSLSVIHRDLSSLNVVLKGDLTPAIWNFGLAYIHHPFQPTNHQLYVDGTTKRKLLSSQYSPPEVLDEKGNLTLTAMKSIDMYACGMIYWELISRCRLPKLIDWDNPSVQKERNEPDQYCEPFEKEFGDAPNREMLKYAVCRLKARPRIKAGWFAGKKTNRFVQLFQDLWDPDFDARLHCLTVIDRLQKLSLSDRDSRYKYPYRHIAKAFDRATMWPPRFHCDQAPPFPDKTGPTLVVEPLVGPTPMRPGQVSSSSSSYDS